MRPEKTQHAGIYFLVDPRTHAVRYVGQSVNLALRRSHYDDVHKGNVGYASSWAVREWIWDVKKAGLKFEFRVAHSRPYDILGTADVRRWLDEMERALIAEMRPTLLNKTPGGSRRAQCAPRKLQPFELFADLA